MTNCDDIYLLTPGDPEHPDKSDRTCCQKCAFGSCILGLLLVITGIVCAFVVKSVVNTKIVENFVLFEGGQVMMMM